MGKKRGGKAVIHAHIPAGVCKVRTWVPILLFECQMNRSNEVCRVLVVCKQVQSFGQVLLLIHPPPKHS